MPDSPSNPVSNRGRRATLRGVALAACGYLCFASADALIKTVVGAYSSFQIIAMQVSFAFLPVFFVIRRGGAFRLPAGINLWLLAARGLLAGIGNLLGLYAFRTLPLADVYSLAFCAPLIVTVLSVPLLGERISPRRWAAVLLGFGGILVMVRPGFRELSLGHLAALLTAFTGAATLLIMRHLRGAEAAATMASAVLLGLLTVSLPVAPFVWVTPPPWDVGTVAIAGVLMGSAQFFMLNAVSHASAAAVAPMQYTMMVWAMVYGVILFANPISPWIVSGCVIVLISTTIADLHKGLTAWRVRRRAARMHLHAATPSPGSS